MSGAGGAAGEVASVRVLVLSTAGGFGSADDDVAVAGGGVLSVVLVWCSSDNLSCISIYF